jgi:hypothetical protein
VGFCVTLSASQNRFWLRFTYAVDIMGEIISVGPGASLLGKSINVFEAVTSAPYPVDVYTVLSLRLFVTLLA